MFIGKDTAIALGYANPRKAIIDHSKYAESFKGNETLPFEMHPQTIIIPEKDVYRLIMRSNLSKAEDFQDWVVDEVLPYPESWPLYANTAIAAEAIDVESGHKRNFSCLFYCRPRNRGHDFMFKSILQAGRMCCLLTLLFMGSLF